MKNAALLLVSILLALAVGEGVVRLVYDPPSRVMPGFDLSTSDYYRRDEQLGWVPNANVHGSHVREGSFATTFSTNSLGLRDREYPLRKPPGITRIVTIGDSFTWGFGVDDDEVYPERLEALLPDTEVINLGVTAYGLRQSIGYLQRVGMGLEPDMVILGLCQNDVFVGRRQSFAQQSGRDSAETPPAGWFAQLKGFLRSNVALYGLLVDALNANRTLVRLGVRLGLKEPLGTFREMDPNIVTGLREYPPELERAWRETLAEVRELADLLEARGVRLVVALVPALQSVDPAALERSLRYSSYEPAAFEAARPYRRLMEFAAAEGLEMIDPLDRFQAEFAAGADLYLPREMHFSADGHRLFAEEIANYLRDTPASRNPVR